MEIIRSPKVIYYCECGNIKTHKDALKCRWCNNNCKSKNIPPKEILEELIWKIPTTQIAKQFNVTDKAVEKWCKKYDIKKPPRGYWQKMRSD